MIITATLITVAAMESRMMNLEKDFCWLKAILLAMNAEMFTIIGYNFSGCNEDDEKRRQTSVGGRQKVVSPQTSVFRAKQ